MLPDGESISVQDVELSGERIGIRISVDEAKLIAERLNDVIAGLQELDVDNKRVLPHEIRERIGRRPFPDEDPYRVFLWLSDLQEVYEGPLAGRRIGLKDNIGVAGMPMTLGSPQLEDLYADADAVLTTKLLGAGAVIVGKLNMDAFSVVGAGLGGVGGFPAPLNPHDPSAACGGSSSGAGAAVASRQVDIAIGGDQGGSIRIPAAWCGVLGLKPTWGLVSTAGVVGHDPSYDHVGPMALSVQDIGLALGVIADRFEGDATSHERAVDPAATRYTGNLGKPIDRIRIGLLREGFGKKVDPQVARSVRGAAGVLEREGATVVEVTEPAHLSAPDAWSALAFEATRLFLATNYAGAFHTGPYPEELATAVGKIRAEGTGIPPTLKLRAIGGEITGRMYGGALYARVQNARQWYRSRYDRLFANVDLLMMPTVPKPAPYLAPHGTQAEAIARTLRPGPAGLGLETVAMNTCPFNYTGHPAMSVPCGKVDGLPVAFQLVGPMFGESKILDVAYAFQELVDWSSIIDVPPEHHE